MPSHEGYGEPQTSNWLGPVVAAGTAAVGSYLSQAATNQKNLQIAREQMAFQERMSSTAYQRSMDDMREAGLNPMLAYGQGGASSPGGASAQMEPAVGAAVASAQQSRQLSADLKSTASLTRLSDAKEWTEVQNRAESRSREDLLQRQSDMVKIQKRIYELQIPGLKNSARVEESGLGRRSAILDRIRQSIFGGRGFVNPVGN